MTQTTDASMGSNTHSRDFIRPQRVFVDYACVDGAHWFRSWQVPGLCAANPDLHKAHRAVAFQLARLAEHYLGAKGIVFEPEASAEDFAAWIEEHGESTVLQVRTTAQAIWRMEPNVNP